MSDSESSTAAPEKEKSAIRGVFSTQEIRKVGTGTTTRKTVQKTFWFVEQAGDVLECQPLNPNFVPSGPKRKITMDELIAKFSPEHEYSRALKVDEENVRANFGIGLTYLERGEKEKAQNIFERIVKLEGTYEPQQKHLFNEFGINLRKNRMFDQAAEYYQRALELTKQDENLHTNLARALFETGNNDGCLEHIFKALELAPKHEISLKFLDWMIKKSLVPADKMPLAQKYLADDSAAENAPAEEKPKENATEQNVTSPQAGNDFSLDLDLDL